MQTQAGHQVGSRECSYDNPIRNMDTGNVVGASPHYGKHTYACINEIYPSLPNEKHLLFSPSNTLHPFLFCGMFSTIVIVYFLSQIKTKHTPHIQRQI